MSNNEIKARGAKNAYAALIKLGVELELSKGNSLFNIIDSELNKRWANKDRDGEWRFGICPVITNLLNSNNLVCEWRDNTLCVFHEARQNCENVNIRYSYF